MSDLRDAIAEVLRASGDWRGSYEEGADAILAMPEMQRLLAMERLVLGGECETCATMKAPPAVCPDWHGPRTPSLADRLKAVRTTAGYYPNDPEIVTDLNAIVAKLRKVTA